MNFHRFYYGFFKHGAKGVQALLRYNLPMQEEKTTSKRKRHGDVLAKRLARILTYFNEGRSLSIEELAEELEVSVRTIRRDLSERLDFLPFEREGKRYRLPEYVLGKLSTKDIENFAALCGAASLFPSLDEAFVVDLLRQRYENNSPYLVKNGGFESVREKKEAFETASKAIVERLPLHFIYNDKRRIANPYKLINHNGVWYLLADDGGVLKTFTFAKIKALYIENGAASFVPNDAFLRRIEKGELDWLGTDTPIEVILEVSNDAKPYFLRKPVLANYEIIEENESGFRVCTKITFDDEILKFVRYWIPYVRIVSPRYLKERLEEMLRSYLDG